MASSGAKPELVDDHEVVAEDGLDDPSDAVVGQAAVEGVDELGGGEVADPMSGVDRGVAERHEHVALAGAGGPDEDRVLRGADPLQRGQVVEGGRGIDEAATSNSSRRLATGKLAADPGSGVGRVAAGDLRFDEGAQELLRRPALRLGGDQQLGGDAAHRGELQPAQTGVEIGGERRRRARSWPAVDGIEPTAAGSARSAAGSPAPRPAAVGPGVPVPAARIERTSAALHRPNAHRPFQGGDQRVSPWAASGPASCSSSPGSRVTPAAAAPIKNVSATWPRARNALLGRGVRPGARRGLSGRAPP